MATFDRYIAGVFLSCMALACLAACSTTGPAVEGPDERIVGEGPERIGTLRTIGDNVFRNNHRARDGEGVYEGDMVSTGPASSAIIDLIGGRFVQLDENTDPEFSFRVASDRSGRRCVHLYIKFGRVWVDSDVVCFDTPDAGGVIDSVVNIEVSAGSTSVTVFSGNVLITVPQEQPLGPGEQAVMARGRIESVRLLSDKELSRVARWRDRFATSPPEDDREPEGWCCSRDESVFYGTEAACRRDGGILYRDRRDAKTRCRSEEEEGWCCSSNLEVFPGTPESCKRQRAGFYRTESLARQACQVRKIEGWCCNRAGRVFFTTDTQCKDEGGTLYKAREYAEADQRCRNEEGWCCSSSSLKVFPGTPELCKRQRAGFYQTEAQARKACTARTIEGWCCNRNGRVFFTTDTQCRDEDGRLYKTQRDAENDRTCRID